MSYSLSCYLVASSHNTYLEGNQLNSFVFKREREREIWHRGTEERVEGKRERT